MANVTLADIAALPDIEPHDGFELVFGNDLLQRMIVMASRVELDEFNDEGDCHVTVHFIECIDLRTRSYVMGGFREETTMEIAHYDHKGNQLWRKTLRVKGIKATTLFDGSKRVAEAYRCVYRILPDTPSD